MPLEDLWPTAQALRRRLRAHYDPAAGQAAESAGLNEPGWTLLLRAHLAAPRPLSAAWLGALNPTINPWTYEAGLQHLAAVGLLGSEAGAYPLTPAGRAALGPILDAVYGTLRALGPLDASALGPLAKLLQSVVSGSLVAPEPPGKVQLRLSHRLAAETPPLPLAAIDQALADLAAYRDDAHLAAWQMHAVSGPAWDVVGSLWPGPAATLAEVFFKLARRGWPRDAYARAVQELVTRGWVSETEPYALTPQGRAVRERAEAQTNTYFFAPWRALGTEALGELGARLKALEAALRLT